MPDRPEGESAALSDIYDIRTNKILFWSQMSLSAFQYSKLIQKLISSENFVFSHNDSYVPLLLMPFLEEKVWFTNIMKIESFFIIIFFFRMWVEGLVKSCYWV